MNLMEYLVVLGVFMIFGSPFFIHMFFHAKKMLYYKREIEKTRQFRKDLDEDQARFERLLKDRED